jgi:hypothetical protein
MEEKHEKLVRWYLRFNGFLTAENYVIHEARNGNGPQGGEFDTLGVRFPHSKEQVDQKLIKNDSRLDDPEAKAANLIDFVIADVKSGNRNKLNSIWQPGNEDEKVGRVRYLLRWMGALGDEQRISDVARRLQKELRVENTAICSVCSISATPTRGRLCLLEFLRSRFAKSQSSSSNYERRAGRGTAWEYGLSMDSGTN